MTTTPPDKKKEDDEPKRPEVLESAKTSPEQARSLFSARPRSNSEVTESTSAIDELASISAASTYGNNAAAPVNTPAAGSTVGDPVDPLKTAKALHKLPYSPPSSVGDNKLEKVETGSTIGKHNLKKTMEKSLRDGVMESTVWEDEAVAMASVGLKRLVQLAKDENAEDPSKSVEQYYSEHLTKIIKEAEVEFDAMSL